MLPNGQAPNSNLAARLQAGLAVRAERVQAAGREWDEAEKPAKITGQQLKVLGAEPQPVGQFHNTTSGGNPVAARQLPGRTVGDWVPRIREEREAKAKRERFYPVFLLEEYFDYVYPPQPGPIVGPPINRTEQRSWIYFNNGAKPTQIPFDDEWQFLASNTVVTPVGESPNVPYSDYGLVIGAYALDGSGISPFLEVFTWFKLWSSANPGDEPANWEFFSFDLRVGQESVVSSVPDFVGAGTTRTAKFEIWVRRKQVVMISLAPKSLYLYHAIADWTINDTHGIYYYKIPVGQKTLTTPTRFASYPGFQGAAEDWRREWPDVATQDPLVVPSNKCYSDWYSSTLYSYSNGYRYSANFDTDATQAQSITASSARILENSPATCTIDSQSRDYLVSYTPPDLTDFPLLPLTQFPGDDVMRIYVAVFTVR